MNFVENCVAARGENGQFDAEFGLPTTPINDPELSCMPAFDKDQPNRLPLMKETF